MPRYQLSIIPTGCHRSTWHGQRDAESAEDAVRRYINDDPSGNTAAAAAQNEGGVVIAGEVDYPKHGYRCHGIELFEVGPIPPAPVERARIVRRIGD